MKHILLIYLLFCVSATQAADFTTDDSGLWNAGATWGNLGSTPGVDYPSTGDNATIANGHIVYISGAENCSALTINSTGSTTELAFFAGSLTATSVELISSGGESKIDEISGGTITVNTNSLIFNQSATGLCSFNLPLGSVAVAGDITVTNTAAANTIIDMSGGSASFNFGGNFAGAGDLTITGGSGGSTFTYNGSVAQTAGTSNAAIVFDNVTFANTHPSGVTLDGALSALNLAGDFTNSGIFTSSVTIDLLGNFTNSGTFTSSGCNINLEGSWNNTGGTYTYFDGDIVTFDGGPFIDQTISGTTSWYNLTVAKGSFFSTLSITSGTQNINNVFDINSGAVSNTGASVVLISDAVRTAQMDDIGTGSYSGDMTVQRYISKSEQTFSSIASPVSGTTLATWKLNGVVFSGFSNSDFPTFPWINCYQYNETSHGSDKDAGWSAATDISNATGSDNTYKAHYVYMDATGFNLSVTGTPTTGAVTVPLDYTNGGDATQDGWNLIGNPYPCTIDFDAVYASNSGNIIDGYLVYSGEYGNYGWYDGATTGSGVGSGGATKDIPHSQGVWLQSINGTDLSVTEAHKVASSDPTFLKSTSPEFMRIYLTGNVNTFQDEALIFPHQTYSNFYDAADLVKFTTMNPDNAPTLSTQSLDGYDLAFNKIGVNSISIPMTAKAGALAQGDYTLDFDIPLDFMLGACITLEDLHTGIITDLRSDTTYAYVSSDTTTLPRFILHLVKGFNTSVVDLACFGSPEGAVTIDGAGITGSTFELLDGAGNAVFSVTAANDTVEFSNVPAGEYQVATNHAGSCSSENLFISVIEPTQVIANFDLAEDTVYLVQGGVLEVNNMSSATNYAWDFGDGNTSIDENPTHVYTAPGIYQVMLSADNDNIDQCTDVTSKNAVVMNGPLSIDAMQLEENTNAFVSNGKVVVDFALENHTNVEIILVDVTGKIILSNQHTISNGRIDLVNTDEVSSGVYFVNITIEGQRKSQKLFID